MAPSRVTFWHPLGFHFGTLAGAILVPIYKLAPSYVAPRGAILVPILFMAPKPMPICMDDKHIGRGEDIRP